MKRSGMNVRLTDLLYRTVDIRLFMQTLLGTFEIECIAVIKTIIIGRLQELIAYQR